MGERVHRPDPLEQVLIETGRLPPVRRTFTLADIEPGWDVIDNEDAPIGRVHAVEEEGLVVHRGVLMPRLYVPLSAVGEVRESAVMLNVPSRWIGTLGWKQPPRIQHLLSWRPPRH